MILTRHSLARPRPRLRGGKLQRESGDRSPLEPALGPAKPDPGAGMSGVWVNHAACKPDVI
jgi:hypothetical protein